MSQSQPPSPLSLTKLVTLVGAGGWLLFLATLDPTAQLFQAQLALLPCLWASGGGGAHAQEHPQEVQSIT